ncbi:ferredoxin 1b isoform X2 [Narcine bancroftii]|uniref:ferredoxin 1b isoform X2 n=1 Tax=Narcine bancroftii TaxID=1343680 RepID=UPI003831C329
MQASLLSKHVTGKSPTAGRMKQRQTIVSMMGHSVVRRQLCELLCEGARFFIRTSRPKDLGVLQPPVNQQRRSVSLSEISRNRSDNELTVHFINQNNEKKTIVSKEGETLLNVVKQNFDIDGFGTCEGCLSCSTCHLIFHDKTFEILDDAKEEELDMLDLAFGRTQTSRMGCQICLKKSLDGMTVKIPK